MFNAILSTGLFLYSLVGNCYKIIVLIWKAALEDIFQMSASTTATEEDTEQLRDLVAATLEKDGILGKIKAQLRSL